MERGQQGVNGTLVQCPSVVVCWGMRFSRSRGRWAAAMVLAWLAAPLPAGAQRQPSQAPRRVLVLYWYDKDYQLNVSTERGFRSVLDAERTLPIEYYAEYLETNRFPGKLQEQA